MISVVRQKTQYGTEYSTVKQNDSITLPQLNSYDVQHPDSKPVQKSELNFTPVAPSFTPVTKRVYPVKTANKPTGSKTVKIKGPVRISGATEESKLNVIVEEDDIEPVTPQQKVLKIFNTVNQSGYQTKTKFETYPTQGYTIPHNIVPEKKVVTINNDSINEYKFKYRSGTQPDSIRDPPLEDLYCLMDSENLYRIKNKRPDGSGNSSGGWSGYKKREILQNYYS